MFWGEYVGIQNLPFTEDLKSFEKRYVKNLAECHSPKIIPRVTTNIELVIETLLKPEITLRDHHLSCAGEQDVCATKNTAICVHYMDDIQKTLVLPGTNYIFSEETQKIVDHRIKNSDDYALSR